MVVQVRRRQVLLELAAELDAPDPPGQALVRPVDVRHRLAYTVLLGAPKLPKVHHLWYCIVKHIENRLYTQIIPA